MTCHDEHDTSTHFRKQLDTVTRQFGLDDADAALFEVADDGAIAGDLTARPETIRHAQLDQIKCAMLAIAGKTDKIVTEESAIRAPAA